MSSGVITKSYLLFILNTVKPVEETQGQLKTSSEAVVPCSVTFDTYLSPWASF